MGSDAMQPADTRRLERLAAQLRLNIVQMMGANRIHHFGGALSAADIVCALYFRQLRYDPADPAWPSRDRFVMSKGHSVPAQYAALAMRGVIPADELATLKQLGSRLQGHPAMHLTPGIEGCTGSLGQGLSYANGMAWAARIRHLDYRVYCLLGDGELHEGQVWEAAQTAPRLCLSNVTAIVDHNHLKAMDDAAGCGKSLTGIAERWASFGWRVREIDGHAMADICAALDWAAAGADGPSVIVAHTVKGKGISFIENQPGFHNAALSDTQYARAMAELEGRLATLEAADD